jgi:hypothetical protein
MNHQGQLLSHRAQRVASPFGALLLLVVLFFASSSMAQGYTYSEWSVGGMRRGVALPLTPAYPVYRYGIRPVIPIYYAPRPYSSYFTPSTLIVTPFMISPLGAVGSGALLSVPPLY